MKKFVSTIVLIAAFALVSFATSTKEVDEKENTTKVETTTLMYTDYKVIQSQYQSNFQNQVKSEMAKGWQPLGGINVNYESATFMYTQAMVK